MKTREQKNAWQRAHRLRNGNADTKKYEKTVPGFLMRAYRNMVSRASGIQKLKAHLYRNCTVLPRADFYAWAAASNEFKRLFSAWQDSDYDQRLTPSVDRRDSDGGYMLDNMRWITHSENSRLGATSPKRQAA
jgi:hypothetical protein